MSYNKGKKSSPPNRADIKKKGSKKSTRNQKPCPNRGKSEDPMPAGPQVTTPVNNTSSGTNHPTWYTKTGGIERLVGANFYKKKAALFTDFANSGVNWLQMPNMTIWLVETIPTDKTNAFYTDIVQLYKNIRRSNSGAANYTVNDLMRYVLNTRAIRAYLASLVRLRRCFNNVDPLSQTVPFDLLNCVLGSSNANMSSWLEELASVDAQLSKMGALIETALPCGDLNIFDRTDWLYGNVFKDSPDEFKYSYIACTSLAYPLYEIDGDGNVVTVTNQPLQKPGTTLSLNQACKKLWEVFSAFNGEYKNALIAGDIMHALGVNAFKRTLNWERVNEPIVPVFNKGIMLQINNATPAYRYAAYLAEAKVVNGVPTQKILYNTSPSTMRSMCFDFDGTYINGDSRTLSGADLLTITRLCWKGTNQENAIQVVSCGTEVPVDITYSYCAADGITANQVEVSRLLSSALSSVQSTAIEAIYRLSSYWSKVDYAPMVLVYTDTEYMPLWDVNNLAFVDYNTLDDYHSAATTSLFWSNMSQ